MTRAKPERCSYRIENVACSSCDALVADSAGGAPAASLCDTPTAAPFTEPASRRGRREHFLRRGRRSYYATRLSISNCIVTAKNYHEAFVADGGPVLSTP